MTDSAFPPPEPAPAAPPRPDLVEEGAGSADAAPAAAEPPPAETVSAGAPHDATHDAPHDAPHDATHDATHEATTSLAAPDVPENPPEVRPAAAADAAPTLSPNECAQQLRQLFPALFGGAVKPLKLRIQVDIQERAPGRFTKQALSAFFRRHTGSTSYLIALSKSAHRFDLDGQAAGDIADEHRHAALAELERRRSNQQARIDLEAQQRRNRATLLHDFQITTLTAANFCALKGVAVDELDGLLALARTEAQGRAAAPRAAHPAPRHAPGGERRPRPDGDRRPRPDGERPRGRPPR